MDLQSTPLKGIVRSSEDGLFYLFPIQSLSTLGHSLNIIKLAN